MTEDGRQMVEIRNQKSNSVYLEMVDFGSMQGRRQGFYDRYSHCYA
jgi:hypothetical protein